MGATEQSLSYLDGSLPADYGCGRRRLQRFAEFGFCPRRRARLTRGLPRARRAAASTRWA
jgi:hypothetical protein